MSMDLKESENDSMEALLIALFLSHMFLFLSYFYITATFYGNTTVGQRFALFTFYAMPRQETLLNSFLANSSFMNVVSCGVKQYAANTFSTWCQGSYTYKIATLTKNSKIWF
mmetsp:Transcript_21313/g.26218  ORF Transcript_21313/g.26218 Transcript_21313/m.26218 type:complete len:112 (+) Transcript_21313:1156-1491(+)